MKIIKGFRNIRSPISRTVLTLGNFDGVHLGHQKIFRTMTKLAKLAGGTSVVYTYDPHPVKVVAPQVAPALLQTEAQKLSSIGKCGVDVCIVEDFTKKFSVLAPEEFFQLVILKTIKPVHIVAGYDFTFGIHRSGTLKLLEKLCAGNDIKFTVVPAMFLKEVLLSSTQARKYVSAGDMAEAENILGRPYAITGIVVKGRGVGKELGFHTANLEVSNELIPPNGVYATKALDHVSVTSIGCNPTFGGSKLSVETHILNYSGDLYGKTIEVMFYKRLRDEEMFASAGALRKQINIDIEETKAFFKRIKK